MALATIVLSILTLPAVFSCGYLLLLTLLSAKLRPVRAPTTRTRFDVIVPAHNEVGVIARTVKNLCRLDWPKDRFRVLVIADNCTDDTATVARAAGAEVIERADAQRRGKGYALEFAFQISRAQALSDAVVVVDADAEASPNLLQAFAARIEQGAAAVQAHYGVLNPWSSWRTRLITIAKAAFHIVRSRARERLDVSSGIRGNGWCVTHELLARVPYHAYSLTEDLEYGIDLGLAGYRVHYADEAHADAEMVSSARTARRQRQRWEDGRFQLIRSKTWPLLLASLQTRSRVCLDLALDLLVLPLSYVTLNVVVLLLATAAASRWDASLTAWFWCALACAAGLLIHVMRGWQLSGLGLRGLADLAGAPIFLIWKVTLMLSHRDSRGWVRTEREHRG
jgi:cellulose synthase/poly-beta-1,6-N-acetylglucosamine synthase-like glycosyltransferase